MDSSLGVGEERRFDYLIKLKQCIEALEIPASCPQPLLAVNSVYGRYLWRFLFYYGSSTFSLLTFISLFSITILSVSLMPPTSNCFYFFPPCSLKSTVMHRYVYLIFPSRTFYPNQISYTFLGSEHTVVAPGLMDQPVFPSGTI